ncbi:MAG: hypothetical protein AB8G86_17970, partial [Saprospiraceae bacterium]
MLLLENGSLLLTQRKLKRCYVLANYFFCFALTLLNLSSNQLTGSIPSTVGNLTNLTSFTLQLNQLTGSIPPEIGNLTNLGNISFSANQLSGTIPPEIGNLTNLSLLLLASNKLTGNIPSTIGNLSNLQTLGMVSNQLTGSIPLEIGNLVNLTSLYLSSNQLTGNIPSEISNLSNLFILDVSSNQLTGNIPAELGDLSLIGNMNLSSNQLTGSIPSNLSNLYDSNNLSNFSTLDLSSNQLSGCWPIDLSNLCGKIVKLENNPNLDEQDFAAFCATNSGACIPIQWENLFTNVDTIWANGAPGPIRINNSEVIPLIAATNCDNIENPIFTVGTEYGEGLVIGMANERPIVDDAGGITTFDNQAFFENTFEFLNNGKGKRIGINNGWAFDGNMTTIKTALEAKGFTFTNLSIPITATQLSTIDVLFMGNDWRNVGTVDQVEVDIVESFVRNGGGALLMGLGWSWPNDLAAYPMNRFASPFGFEFISNYFSEPINHYSLWPYFVNMYPNIDLDAICPPFTCPANTDSLALMAFYHATDGPNWGYDGGWGSHCKLSTWHGVITNEEGRVISLDLHNNNLSGTLPTELGNLSELQTLRL